MELGLLVPPYRLEIVAKIGFFFRRIGSGTVVVLIITLTTVFIDEILLDGAFQPARHVVVDSTQADSHTDGLTATVHQAMLRLRALKGEVDGTDGGTRTPGIRFKDRMQTVVLHRTVTAETRHIALAFLFEDLFPRR